MFAWCVAASLRRILRAKLIQRGGVPFANPPRSVVGVFEFGVQCPASSKSKTWIAAVAERVSR